MKKLLVLLLFVIPFLAGAQGSIKWATDGSGYYAVEADEIVKYLLPDKTREVVARKQDLTPAGGSPIKVRTFYFSPDQSKVLVFTNTKKVWRLDTRGDYWVVDLATKKLQQVGKGLPASTLLFAKFSPDSKKVAYVSQSNVYCDDLTAGKTVQLTMDGTRKHINGTFDWAYEEEFSCRDGITWSQDSEHLAFWQIDATRIRDFYMINNTDSVYSKIVPVEYPTAGQSPSPARIGVINVNTQKLTWLALPGDPQQHYLPRAEWNAPDALFVQQLNRKQNESKIFNVNPSTGDAKLIYSEKDNAWIDVLTPWQNSYALDFRHRIQWLAGGKEFLWFSEKDGWRHIYRITKEGKETLVTAGNYDVMDLRYVDEANNQVYFLASMSNATQKYLYRCRLDGKGKAEMVSPATQSGTHDYQVSPSGRFAYHTFSNSYTRPLGEWISFPSEQALRSSDGIDARLAAAQVEKTVEFLDRKSVV